MVKENKHGNPISDIRDLCLFSLIVNNLWILFLICLLLWF